MYITESQHFKYAAIELRNDHLKHCDENCNICLSDLLTMAERAGAVFTKEEREAFTGIGEMHFTS